MLFAALIGINAALALAGALGQYSPELQCDRLEGLIQTISYRGWSVYDLRWIGRGSLVSSHHFVSRVSGHSSRLST